VKHLLKIVTNTKDYEGATGTISISVGNTKVPHQKRIAYKINGFWFYLSRVQWAEYCGVNYPTLCGRQKAGKPIAQVLGYEPIPKWQKGRRKVS
jgi:hypothetical protein